MWCNILLVRLQEKFEIDQSLDWKGYQQPFKGLKSHNFPGGAWLPYLVNAYQRFSPLTHEHGPRSLHSMHPAPKFILILIPAERNLAGNLNLSVRRPKAKRGLSSSGRKLPLPQRATERDETERDATKRNTPSDANELDGIRALEPTEPGEQNVEQQLANRNRELEIIREVEEAGSKSADAAGSLHAREPRMSPHSSGLQFPGQGSVGSWGGLSAHMSSGTLNGGHPPQVQSAQPLPQNTITVNGKVYQTQGIIGKGGSSKASLLSITLAARQAKQQVIGLRGGEGRAKRGHTVAATLLTWSCFPNVSSFATRATILSDTNFVSWTQKMFHISCVRAARNNVASFLPRTGNIAGHNVAATMWPRFARGPWGNGARRRMTFQTIDSLDCARLQ